MAKIFPFKAIRPVVNKVHLITTRSYISYTKAQLKRKLASNPFSFIHVLNPELPTPNVSLKEKFKQVGRSFNVFLGKKYFLEEEIPSFYLYQQEHEGNSFTGIVSLVSLEDYKNSIIKKHELTLELREEMFKDYLSETQIHAEPVLLTYRGKKEIKELIENSTKNTPIYDFVTHDEVLHKVWKIDDITTIEVLQNKFSDISSLYIADGHHRSASSLRLYEDFKNEKYSKFLSLLIADDELNIKGYHRIIDLNKLSVDEFLKLFEKHYSIEEVGHSVIKNNLNTFLFANQNWHEVKPKEKIELLPVEYFTLKIIEQELKIKNVRSSKRLRYIDSSVSISEFEQQVSKNNNAIGLVLPALTTEQLMKVSDENKTLPPKSTWIEPKLRSALLIYKYE